MDQHGPQQPQQYPEGAANFSSPPVNGPRSTASHDQYTYGAGYTRPSLGKNGREMTPQRPTSDNYGMSSGEFKYHCVI